MKRPDDWRRLSESELDEQIEDLRRQQAAERARAAAEDRKTRTARLDPGQQQRLAAALTNGYLSLPRNDRALANLWYDTCRAQARPFTLVVQLQGAALVELDMVTTGRRLTEAERQDLAEILARSGPGAAVELTDRVARRRDTPPEKADALAAALVERVLHGPQHNAGPTGDRRNDGQEDAVSAMPAP